MQAKLRSAVFDGVKESDVVGVVQGIVERAKKGDKDAVKYFFDYILGGKGPSVHATQHNYYNGEPPAGEPVDHAPGSLEKLEAMRARVAKGQAAMNDQDSC